MFRTYLEKVVVHCLADLEKQVGVYPRVLEQFVHILTCTIDLRRQPSDAAPLSRQFCSDYLPDVETVVRVLMMLAHGLLSSWLHLARKQ